MDLANETFGQYMPDTMKADEGFKPYADMKGIDLINAHKELSGQVKTATETQAQFEARLSKAVEPLPENATPEQQKEHQAKVRGLMGVPEKPADYKLNLPETVKADDPLLSAYVSRAHEAGMNPAQVQAGVDAFINYAEEANKAQLEATNTALKAAWGPNYEANLKKSWLTLEAVAKEAGLPTTELASLQYLRGNAGFVQMLFKLSRHYGEAELSGAGGGGGPGSDTNKSAVDRLAEKIGARTKQ